MYESSSPSGRTPQRRAVRFQRIGFLLAIASIAFAANPVDAQGRYGGRRWGRGESERTPEINDYKTDKFTFATVHYHQVRTEKMGLGWITDFPDAGHFFMLRLAELTTIDIERRADGEPRQVVVKLDEPSLFNYPFIFMSDVGTLEFNDEEVVNLRRYLLNGGFLYADDFWGDFAMVNWQTELEKVLDPREYKIIDIPLSHPIFSIVFKITEVPQVPSIQFWDESRGATSERGLGSAKASMKGIWDKNGRLMVVMTHNTDIADGWEREIDNIEFFNEFSIKKSYPLGINIVVYAMTH